MDELAKPRKGGSKPGKVCINWVHDPLGRLYKIAMQRIMELTGPHVEFTRNFRGQYGPVVLLDYMEKHDPEFYDMLMYSKGVDQPRTRGEMLSVLYDRGHKGFYWNDGDRRTTARACKSPEHYSRSKHLYDYTQEAEAKFKSLLTES